ncbi:thioesterase [Glaciecola punicea]|jgi:uncharacterized protein (TIGR00369 family)|uniref:PaaI family thioesterase n=1 Tax=Glaciecola punicea TaxID=56804 RepID=UPI000872BDE7|nr:PaaI family thioesterase [Glaciecola punicea]OFA29870.1 thioesterase [Glaciecola punicea]
MTDLTQQGFTLCSPLKGFSALAGPYYEKHENQVITRAFVIEDKHLNPEGVTHGGALLSFADYIIYRAIGDEVGHILKFATINLNNNFVSAAKAGDIVYGTGKVVRKARDVIFGEGQIFTEQKTIMHSSGIWKIIV